MQGFTVEVSVSLFQQSPDNQVLSDKWTEIEFALQMLGISEEESKGIWAILAAICHLGCAGVAVGKYTISLTFYSYNRRHMCCAAIKEATCIMMSYIWSMYISQ